MSKKNEKLIPQSIECYLWDRKQKWSIRIFFQMRDFRVVKEYNWLEIDQIEDRYRYSWVKTNDWSG